MDLLQYELGGDKQHSSSISQIKHLYFSYLNLIICHVFKFLFVLILQFYFNRLLEK